MPDLTQGLTPQRTWFQVGTSSGYKFNVENMKIYDIMNSKMLSTDKFKGIIINGNNETWKKLIN